MEVIGMVIEICTLKERRWCMCRWPLPFRWKGKALQKKRGTDRMIKFENSFITSDSSRELSRPVKGVPFRRVNHAELEFPPWARL